MTERNTMNPVESIVDSVAEVLQPLVGMTMVKAVQDGDTWKFAGIASDETEDVEGDTILRKALDVSYAQRP